MRNVRYRIRRMVIGLRVWLLRKLSMGRPIVMNGLIDGLVDMGGTDEWALIAGCDVKGSSGKTVLRPREVTRALPIQ